MSNQAMQAIRVVTRRGIGPGDWAQKVEARRNYCRRQDAIQNPNRRKFSRPKHQEKSSTRFFCKTCGKEMASPEEMNAHWRAVHPEIFSEAWLSRRGQAWRRGVRNGRGNGRTGNGGR